MVLGRPVSGRDALLRGVGTWKASAVQQAPKTRMFVPSGPTSAAAWLRDPSANPDPAPYLAPGLALDPVGAQIRHTSSVLESGAPPNDTNLVIARPGSPFDCSKTAVGCIRPSLEVGPRNEHILHHVGEAAKTRVEDDGHHLITKPLPPLLIPMEHKINTRCRSLPSSLPVPIHSQSEARESVQNLAETGFVQDSQTNNPQCEDKNNFACESRINA